MEDVLLRNWPILIFLFAQVIGSWKILSNIKSVNDETNTGLKVIEVRIKGLEDQIKKQNGRVNKLEDTCEKINISVAAHHGDGHVH